MTFSTRTIGYYAEFEKSKIIFPDIAPSPRFSFDTIGYVLGNTAYIVPVKEHWLTGLLNSNVIHFAYDSLSSQIRGGYYRFTYQYISQLPIPNLLDRLRDQITALTQRCLDAAKSSPESLPTLEAELNALVYQAYGLDADDIRVIEGYLAGQSHDDNDSVGSESTNSSTLIEKESEN